MLFQLTSQTSSKKNDWSQKIELSPSGSYQNGHVVQEYGSFVPKPDAKAGYSAFEMWGDRNNKLIGCAIRGNDIIINTGFGQEDILAGALGKDLGFSFKVTVIDGTNAKVEVFSYSGKALLERDVSLDAPINDMRKLHVLRYANYGSQEPRLTESQKKGQRYVEDSSFTRYAPDQIKKSVEEQAKSTFSEDLSTKLIGIGTNVIIFSSLIALREKFARRHIIGRAAMPDYAIAVEAELDKFLTRVIFENENADFRNHMNNICQKPEQKTAFLNYVKAELLNVSYAPGEGALAQGEVSNRLSEAKNKKGSKPMDKINQKNPRPTGSRIWGFKYKGSILKWRGEHFMEAYMPDAIANALESFKKDPTFNQFNDKTIAEMNEARMELEIKGSPPDKAHQFTNPRMQKQLESESKKLGKSIKKAWKAEFNSQMWVDLKGAFGTGILPAQYNGVVEHNIRVHREAFWKRMLKEKLIDAKQYEQITREGRQWKEAVKSTEKQGKIVKYATKLSSIYKEYLFVDKPNYAMFFKELGFSVKEKIKPFGKIRAEEAPKEKFGVKTLYSKSYWAQAAIILAFLAWEFSGLFTTSTKKGGTGEVYTGNEPLRVIKTTNLYDEKVEKVGPSFNMQNGTYVYSSWIGTPSKQVDGKNYNQASFEGLATKDGRSLFSIKMKDDGALSVAARGFGERVIPANAMRGLDGATFMLFIDPNRRTAAVAVYSRTGAQLDKTELEWNPAFENPQTSLAVNRKLTYQKFK